MTLANMKRFRNIRYFSFAKLKFDFKAVFWNNNACFSSFFEISIAVFVIVFITSAASRSISIRELSFKILEIPRINFLFHII